MILITGGAGFIGSNLVRYLNQIGHNKITIIDDLTNGQKIYNLNRAIFTDYYDIDEFYFNAIDKIIQNAEVVFHLGAISSTSELNGKRLMHYNYSYSKQLYEKCQTYSVPFIYASSASVYGQCETFSEDDLGHPLNPYAFSKWQFDRFILSQQKQCSPVVGLRYFNVYGPNEEHKLGQSSPFTTFYNQFKQHGKIKLFEGSKNFKRDFIHVNDVVKITFWAWKNKVNGILNVGTGQARSFLDIAKLITDNIQYIPFPESLKSSYQYHTCANCDKIKYLGYQEPMIDVQEGWRLLRNSFSQTQSHLMQVNEVDQALHDDTHP